jgi:hypothetical protein
MAQRFEVIIEDQRFRSYRVTFERAHRGSFPKQVKLERYQTNGKDYFWTLYRPCCHGDLEAHTKQEIAKAAHAIRYQD